MELQSRLASPRWFLQRRPLIVCGKAPASKPTSPTAWTLRPRPQRVPFAFFAPSCWRSGCWLPPALQADTRPHSQALPPFLARMQHMPKLVTEAGAAVCGARTYQGLWPAQITAIPTWKQSLSANKPAP